MLAALVELCNVIVEAVKLVTFHVLFNKVNEALPENLVLEKHLILSLPHKFHLLLYSDLQQLLINYYLQNQS
jgi:hypothetical protein